MEAIEVESAPAQAPGKGKSKGKGKAAAPEVLAEPKAEKALIGDLAVAADGAKAHKDQAPKAKAEKAEKAEKAPKAEVAQPATLATVEMTDSEKGDLRETVKARAAAVNDGYWALAESLEIVVANSLYSEWGFKDLESYVENELGIGLRSAQYMLKTFRYFGALPEEIQGWVKEIGWSKAKELIGRVTVENWKSLRKELAGKTVAQILAYFKTEKVDVAGSEKDGEEEKAVKISFILFKDQQKVVESAIDQVKAETGTDKPGEALTRVCQGFLSGGGAISLDQTLAQIEASFGVKLIATKDAGSDVEIVYGGDSLDELISGYADAADSDDGSDDGSDDTDNTDAE